jgi:hypothetical protein
MVISPANLTSALIADRLDLLAECAAIDRELARIERLHGRDSLIDAARVRNQRALRDVVTQLWALVSSTETAH